jgi:hypothetical protein
MKKTADDINVHNDAGEQFESYAHEAIDTYINSEGGTERLKHILNQVVGLKKHAKPGQEISVIPVLDESDVENVFMNELSDYVFEEVILDSGHTKRFFDFYLKSQGQDIVNKFIDEYEHGQLGKFDGERISSNKVATMLNQIASAIENSKNPSRSLVASDLQRVLRLLK